MRFFITDHAADRWVERAAVYGDDGKADVEAAVQAATRVEDPVQIPFARVGNVHYYHHEPSGVWFVVEPINAHSGRVVTVIDPTGKRNHLAAKSKVTDRKKQAPDTPGQPLGGPFADIGEERAWLLATVKEVAAQLGRLSKTQPAYKTWARHYQALVARLTAIRGAYREFQQARFNEQMEARAATAVEAGSVASLYRDDGSLDWQAAIPYLMRRALEQQEEIDRLKERLTELEKARFA